MANSAQAKKERDKLYEGQKLIRLEDLVYELS